MSGVAIKMGVYGLVRFSGWLPVPAAGADQILHHFVQITARDLGHPGQLIGCGMLLRRLPQQDRNAECILCRFGQHG